MGRDGRRDIEQTVAAVWSARRSIVVAYHVLMSREPNGLQQEPVD